MTWISQESSLTNARPPHVDRDTVSPSPEMVSASGCVVEPVRFVTYKVAARREPDGVAANASCEIGPAPVSTIQPPDPAPTSMAASAGPGASGFSDAPWHAANTTNTTAILPVRTLELQHGAWGHTRPIRPTRDGAGME